MNSDAAYVKVGSIQIQPEACKQYISKLNLFRVSEKENTEFILCPLTHCSPRAAFSVRRSVTQSYENIQTSTYAL